MNRDYDGNNTKATLITDPILQFTVLMTGLLTPHNVSTNTLKSSWAAYNSSLKNMLKILAAVSDQFGSSKSPSFLFE